MHFVGIFTKLKRIQIPNSLQTSIMLGGFGNDKVLEVKQQILHV